MDDSAVMVPAMFSRYPELRSGMSTRRGRRSETGFEMNLSYRVGDDPASVERNRELFFSQCGISGAALAVPLQIHSSVVRTAEIPGDYPDCDALVTGTSGLALTVMVADCVPVFLFDPLHHAIGLVHAGWRGTVNLIVKRAVEKMQEEFGTQTEHVLASIGPSAGPCCYEVGEDVAVKFGKKIVPYLLPKYFIDLKKENALQLQQSGVVPGNIEISAHCTICEPHLFHSYRRDGKRAGRMMAALSVIS